MYLRLRPGCSCEHNVKGACYADRKSVELCWTLSGTVAGMAVQCNTACEDMLHDLTVLGIKEQTQAAALTCKALVMVMSNR